MDTATIVRGIAVVVAGYLIGGVPWGIVVARVVGGPDPRTIGSGRTGGANTSRAIGPRAAAVAGLLDLLKGSAVVLIARFVGAGAEFEILAALAAILGHSRSPYIGFGGGRGVAPGFGGLLVIQPLVAAVAIPIFVLVFIASRYSSLASLSAAGVAGIAMIVLVVVAHLPPAYLLYAVGGTAMIYFFHLDNIQRLMSGRERKMGSGG
jgi:glycerol-3-phosphate acyltransferase PlsY